MKSLINYALFKEQIKRFWTISAMSLLMFVLFVISPLHSDAGDYNTTYFAESVIRVLTMRNPIVVIVCVAFPFGVVLSMFSYLFRPNSAAAMHSFPFSKKQLFFTNMAAGLTMFTIPLLITCAFLLNPVVWRLPEVRITPDGVQYLGYVPSLPAELFPNGLAEGAVINTLPNVALFFFLALLIFVFYYAVCTLAVTVTGNAVVYVLLCGAMPLIPCAFLLLGELTAMFYFFGFDSYRFDDILSTVLEYTNPAAIGSIFTFYHPAETISSASSNIGLRIGIYVVLAAALLVLSYWCGGARKQERAGDSVVFTPLKNVLIFLLSTLGMIMLGAFMLSVFGKVALMYAGLALGFVITYFIAQMIAEKTFNVLYKVKEILYFGGVMAVLFAAVILAARFDIFGYQTYSPQEGEVAGVYLYPQHTMNIYYGIAEDEKIREFCVTDERIIADTLTVHKRITEQRHNLRSAFLRSLERSYGNDGDDISQQTMMFLLENGKIVTRTYQLPKSFRQSSGLTALLSEEEVILSQYVPLRKPEEIDNISFQYSAERSKEYDDYDKYVEIQPVYIDQPEDIASVIEEVKKDIIASERKRLVSEGDEMYNEESIYVYSESTTDDRSGRTYNLSVTLFSFENIDRWLESRDLKPDIKK